MFSFTILLNTKLIPAAIQGNLTNSYQSLWHRSPMNHRSTQICYAQKHFLEKICLSSSSKYMVEGKWDQLPLESHFKRD